MYLSEDLQKKWGPVLEHGDLPKIKDQYRKAVTAVLLENQEKSMREQADSGGMFGTLSETAPSGHNNQMGVGASGGDNINYVDPVLISLVRRAMPNLIAYDVCGVQPMNGPTGLIFAMKSHYTTQDGAEALHDEADTGFSGTGSQGSQTGTMQGAPATGMGTAAAEDVTFPEMAFAIDKVTVTAKSRALKAEYTMELAQDLKAVHGLDAETELSNILSSEILAEINREVMRTIYTNAKPGAQHNTATPGTFDLDTDSNGRWSVEKFKGLMFQIEREANAIAKDTRRGKGNVLITSSDVASALAMAGQLSGVPTGNDIHADDTGTTMVGTLNGRYKVFVDPYAPTSATNFFTVGYKGSSAYDAGLFYCPYVPLQMVRAVGENSFQPKIGFKTRYGLVSNPFANDTGASGNGVGDGSLTANLNRYYRHVIVANLM